MLRLSHRRSGAFLASARLLEGCPGRERPDSPSDADGGDDADGTDAAVVEKESEMPVRSTRARALKIITFRTHKRASTISGNAEVYFCAGW